MRAQFPRGGGNFSEKNLKNRYAKVGGAKMKRDQREREREIARYAVTFLQFLLRRVTRVTVAIAGIAACNIVIYDSN